MGLAKSEPSSVGYTHMDLPKVRYSPPLVQKEEVGETVDEAVEALDSNYYTHEQALAHMDITESEFLELLIETGNCPSGKLEKKQMYPVELIFEIDPEKWIDPKVYTLEELYGDVVHNTYTLDQSIKILEISKSELREQLVESRYCSTEEFDSIKEFPFEWLWAIDPYV